MLNGEETAAGSRSLLSKTVQCFAVENRAVFHIAIGVKPGIRGGGLAMTKVVAQLPLCLALSLPHVSSTRANVPDRTLLSRKISDDKMHVVQPLHLV